MTVMLVLVVSLMQLPCCEVFASEASVAAATTVSGVDAADVIVKQAAELPAQKSSHTPATHCDHCLAHVAFQPFFTAVASRVDFISIAVALPNDAAPAGVAGLPLFKPPRV